VLESARLAESRVDRRTGSGVLHSFTISVALWSRRLLPKYGHRSDGYRRVYAATVVVDGAGHILSSRWWGWWEDHRRRWGENHRRCRMFIRL